MPDISVSPKVDPITKILTKQAPNMRDVGKALLRASTGKTTYGEALNTMRAKELKEAQVLHNITTTNRRLDQEDTKIAQSAQRIEIDKAKLAAKSNTDIQFLEQVDKIYGDDAPAVLGALHAAKHDFSGVDLSGRMQAASNYYRSMRGKKELPSQAVKPKEYSPNMKMLDVPTGETNAEGVPVLAKQWFDMNDRKDIKRAKDMGAIESPDQKPSTRYQSGGAFVDEEGGYIGQAVFDRQTGRFEMEGGTPVPPGAEPRTKGALGKNIFSGTDFKKLASTAAEEERSLRAMQNYMANVKDTDQGLALIADELYGQFKTVFGKDITPEEYRTLVQEGQLQRLLGGFRKEVVGGGVMTEYDARRVLMALGGDVSLLRNKQVATTLLRDIMIEKAREYNEVTVPLYNAQLKVARRGKFKPKELIDIGSLEPATTAKDTPEGVPEGVTPEEWGAMTDEERALFK